MSTYVLPGPTGLVQCYPFHVPAIRRTNYLLTYVPRHDCAAQQQQTHYTHLEKSAGLLIVTNPGKSSVTGNIKFERICIVIIGFTKPPSSLLQALLWNSFFFCQNLVLLKRFFTLDEFEKKIKIRSVGQMESIQRNNF